MTYPPHDPYRTGSVETTDRASLYVEESGRPDGVPALWLHGGPGGSLGRGGYRRAFDPRAYRLVGIDQRGTGRSTPSVAGDPAGLERHTTQRLVADLEEVRDRLGIESWVVGGVSWGTTLALAYGEEHPDRVRALALKAVTTTSRDEVDWITEGGVGRLFPEEWAVFDRESRRRDDERPVDAYARRLASDDAADREAAAASWDRWEGVHVSLDDPDSRGRGHLGPGRREAFATLVTRYWSNDGFLSGERSVMARLPRIGHIPGALVHGRRDVSGPAVTPWRLHRAWPASTLTVVEDEGHGGPGQVEALGSALDVFARR
ncbi:alpha/beta fold hydrolase [Frigoribacterium sp. PhB24]|uniref:alpha/beta fold hydrolase n=1 Tax=Frigoribacterium sp. PhB24 TaxID=2485204 RepID=UPI000F465A54|nr:alpha/beta fold hydrolase [Frigoribacterium sp. PhB24]ROS52640.1 proline iminopeptidase [Frigoribacterium sp. PhB24]